MPPSKQDILAGQAIFTNPVLKFYDWWVLKLTNHLIWRCPTSALLSAYNQHITSNHLDVGIGTGYYLDHCQFPTKNPHLVLMDMNQETLKFCSKKLSRYKPKCYRHNIFEPISIENKKFDSIGLNYVLHCLPGNIQTKGIVLKNLSSLLNNGGILFGSTLLMKETPLSFWAKTFMKFYNAKKIFSNQNDTLSDLKNELSKYFEEFDLMLIGCVALFWGRK